MLKINIIRNISTIWKGRSHNPAKEVIMVRFITELTKAE